MIHVINAMGWKRSGTVNLFVDFEILPANKKVKIIDLSTSMEVPAQLVRKRAEGAYWDLDVKDIPALGVKSLKILVTDQAPEPNRTASQTEALENPYYRLVVDKSTGAISSLYDKELQLEPDRSAKSVENRTGHPRNLARQEYLSSHAYFCFQCKD